MEKWQAQGTVFPKGTNLSFWCGSGAEVAGSMRIPGENGNKRIRCFPRSGF